MSLLFRLEIRTLSYSVPPLLLPGPAQVRSNKKHTTPPPDRLLTGPTLRYPICGGRLSHPAFTAASRQSGRVVVPWYVGPGQGKANYPTYLGIISSLQNRQVIMPTEGPPQDLQKELFTANGANTWVRRGNEVR